MPSDSESNDWIDQELRRVAVPRGLLARLRRVATSDDAMLDAALRDVPLPHGFMQRLQGSGVCDDAWLDTQLAHVAVPVSLIEKLESIPHYADEHIDAMVRDVRVPERLIARLHRIPQQVSRVGLRRSVRPHRDWMRLAVAASLVFMVSAFYLMAIGRFVATAYRDTPERPWAVVVSQPPLDLQLATEAEVQLVNMVLDERKPFAASTPLPGIVEVPPAMNLLDTEDVLASGPLGELNRRFGSSSELLWLPLPLFGIAPFADQVHDLPQPHLVPALTARGVSQDWTDLKLLLALTVGRTHPFVDPSASTVLESTRVPLDATTASYERAWEMIRLAGSGPSDVARLRRKLANRVRTEDFIHAIDYGTAPRGKEPRLQAHGGPSWYGDGDDQLLQVLVQTPKVIRRDAKPLHCVVVVVTSESMRRDGSLAHVRRALDRLVQRLAPGDHISLVATHGTADVLVREAAARDADVLRQAIDRLRPQSGSNLGEGLRVAATVAYETALTDPHRNHSVVLLSAGADPMDDLSSRKLESLVRKFQTDEIRFSVIDAGRAMSLDPLLVRLAAAAHRQVVAVRSTEDLSWALADACTGQSQSIADDARLTVTFNPERVVSYRLMGHEATSSVGVVEAPAVVDIPAGRTAVGLFEIRMKREGAGDVGWMDLTWRDPQTGRARRQRLSIGSTEFALSFAESAVALQAATVVAEAAELLRDSPYATRTRSSLTLVRTRCQSVDRRIQQEPSFQRFVRFLDRAIDAGLR